MIKTKKNVIISKISKGPVTALAIITAAFLAFGTATFAGSALWDSAPTTTDWNTATNWTPETVPNGPSDIATFDVSNTTAISVSVDQTEVDGIVFNAVASPYTITANTGVQFIMSGSGITNNSGTTQTFVAGAATISSSGIIRFRDSASAGSLTAFITEGATNAFKRGGLITIAFSASAGDGMFVNSGGAGGGFGETAFSGDATAANGTFTNNGGAVSGASGGRDDFFS